MKQAKPLKTKAELDEDKLIRQINNAPKKLITAIVDQIKTGGLRAVEMQRDFIATSNTKLPSEHIGRERTVECYNEAIENYKKLSSSPPGGN